MTRSDETHTSDSESIAINTLPTTTLQSIYHAVTGKTENLSKYLYRNVEIKSLDIDRLHQMIRDQIGHYGVLADPTVTIIVKTSDKKTITYSSWERFSTLRTGKFDVTDSILLKIEFVIKLEAALQPQRFSISIDMDSSLPMLLRQNSEQNDLESFSYLFFIKHKWPTIEISIDFVDFVVAKLFCSTVEEWFNTLDSTQDNKYNRFLFNKQDTIRDVMAQSGRFGMATFLISISIFAQDNFFNLRSAIFATSIGIFIWALFSILESIITKN